MPCPLPRRTEPVRLSVASRLVRPSPYLRRVGVRDFPFEACSGLLRVTACQLARPAFPGLCHEASARPIARPRCSSASMLTDNYIGGLLPPTGCPRRKGALRNEGYASRDGSFDATRLTAVGRQSGGWIVLLTSACRHRWSLSGWAWGTTSRGGHRAGGRARRPGCSSWCRSRKRLARSSKNQSLLIFPARNGI